MTNVNDAGVINGGRFEFELAFQPDNNTRAAATAGAVSLSAEIARSRHTTRASLK